MNMNYPSLHGPLHPTSYISCSLPALTESLLATRPAVKEVVTAFPQHGAARGFRAGLISIACTALSVGAHVACSRCLCGSSRRRRCCTDRCSTDRCSHGGCGGGCDGSGRGRDSTRGTGRTSTFAKQSSAASTTVGISRAAPTSRRAAVAKCRALAGLTITTLTVNGHGSSAGYRRRR